MVSRLYKNSSTSIRRFSLKDCSQPIYDGLWRSAVKNEIFLVSKNFFVNLDFKNECQNEFQDNNEKSSSWFENRFPHKSDFRADGTHESHSIAWELSPRSHLFDDRIYSRNKNFNILLNLINISVSFLKNVLSVYLWDEECANKFNM